MDKPLAKQTKKKDKSHKVSKIRNETEVMTEPAAVGRVIQAQFKQLYTYNFDNLDEMDQFLPKLTQEETETLD